MAEHIKENCPDINKDFLRGGVNWNEFNEIKAKCNKSQKEAIINEIEKMSSYNVPGSN